jgi:cohesin loading factor subunit SCC2
VKVKPLPPRARPEEYRRIDAPVPGESPSKKKPRVDAEPPAVKSREREIADRQLNDLSSLLDEMSESRDTDQAEYFLSLTTDDGELSVLRDTALARLSDAVLKLINLGCFPAVPPKRILMLQSLCEPLISATSRLSLDIESSSGEELLDRLTQAETGLRACKLVLQSMTEGCDDRRICSEDLVQGIIRLLKHVLVSCITPVVESRRTGSSSELFNIASQHRSEIHRVLRHCGSILSQIAALIGKIKLTGFTLSPIESLSIEIIFTQNGEKEADSALGIQKFEAFRQRAMDVIAQIFACHPDQRDSVVVDILNNLARLPDKRASARNFKSARESPIMLASALFMRIVQASASNSSDNTEASLPTDSSSEDEDADGDSDSEAQGPPSKPRKAAHTPHQAPRQIAAQLEASARKVAGHIATTMVSRAENVSKSGDKPFRNLLDLFVEDLCSVLGSPEWPAASVFLESLLAIMVPFTKNTKDKGVQAADMALSTMGSMGVGVIDFTTRLKAVKRSLDITQSELASKLVPLAEDALKRNINIKDVLGLDGPYRVVLESLSIYLNPQGSRVNRENPHLRSLSSYFATSWANAFYKVFGDEERKEGSYHQFVDALEKHIKKVIMDPEWFSKE